MRIFKRSEYGALKMRLALWTLLLAGVFILFLLAVQAIHAGRFATPIQGLLQSLLQMDYNQAWEFYVAHIRGGSGVILYCIFGVILLLIVYQLLNRFIRYFTAVNQGMDALLTDGGDDVSLPPELVETEKKINAIKHTLEKRKTDAMVAEQRKNDLVVYLAHDLKTPLTSVIGYLSLLRDEPQISEELREKYLAISLDKSERLEDLINEFFEITRFNLSSIELKYSHINLSRMLEQLVFEFQPMLAERQLQCQLDCPPDLMMKCDPDKLQRVLDNLLRNAAAYCYPGSCVRIAVEAGSVRKSLDGEATPNETDLSERTDTVTLRFTNQGDTIPPQKLSRIFEQFYRLDSSRNSASGGAGLGLAISKQIIELHHGSITASSQDEVTEFTIVLPLDPEQAEKAATESLQDQVKVTEMPKNGETKSRGFATSDG